ncbi:nocobactin polyketide synthase NbtC [Antrihabitans stalactiti]|uniref:nocobactin polyketide synthase NbtC n=1 Tax=Antrihabitans stalactiti TaxID=2584121 RepID=UPI001F115A12|nr:nocobactin polyketide synthase NbtC [Antrihabitans stalactiti]
MRTEAAALFDYATAHPEIGPDRIASMLFRTRVARRYRALAMVADRDELLAALRAIAAGEEHSKVVATTTPAASHRVGYVFPGQGGQHPGMGRLFYDRSPAFRAEIDSCEAVFQELYGSSPLSYVLEDEGPIDANVKIVQPAMFMQMAGLAAMWRSYGVAPSVTVGHSQGEITAAYLSGTISQRDAIRVVTTRAVVVDAIVPEGYSMAVIGIGRDECEALLARHSGWMELSVINAPNLICISGNRPAVCDIVDKLVAQGTFAKEIRVQYPAHTCMLDDFQDGLRTAIAGKTDSDVFFETDIPCIGATLGDAITADLPVDEYWYWNLRNKVRFDQAITTAATRHGIDTFVEIADHPTLMLAVQENLSTVVTDGAFRVAGTSRRTAPDLGEFTRNLATIAVHDANYPWEVLRTDDDAPVELPLRGFPTVVMNDRKLWLPYLSDEALAADAPATYPHRLVETWVKLGRRSLLEPRTIAVVDLADANGDLVTALEAEAIEHGATARRLVPETSGFDTLVVLLPEPTELDATATIAAVARFFGDREWWPQVRAGLVDCWLVTTSGETVLDGDAAPELFNGSVSAGFRCIGTEYPDIAFRHLDLSLDRPKPEQAAAVVSALHTATESELALRGGKVYVKRLVEAAPAADEAFDADLSHVVITGGTGKLGLEFGEHFARAGAERITLLSRSGESAATADRVRKIRSIGSTQVAVIACDIGDEAEVAELSAALAPASLIVHSAVDYSDSEFADITAEHVESAARAKVVGVDNVLRALHRTEQARVVLCSSIAANLGGRGQVIYAVTNRILDVLAQRLRADGIDAVAIGWGMWSVHFDLDAAGLARLRSTGVIPMAPADAIAVGLTDDRRNAIVAAADWSVVRSVLGSFGYGPLLSELGELDAPPTVVKPADAAPAVAVPVLATPSIDFANVVLHELNRVMGIDDADLIDTSIPLVALGLDSLQALDFRKRVKSSLDRELPVSAILGGASLDEVVRLLVQN